MPWDMVGRWIRVTGVVQGVGFRPYVFRLAQEEGIQGWVQNGSDGVLILAEGRECALEQFTRRLVGSPPPLASIHHLNIEDTWPRGFTGFYIRESEEQEETRVGIPPDTAICDDCRREVVDTANRRYRYPFTNCTNCGPRFTIIKDLPYDRSRTTMERFSMCLECHREYDDPRDRRFHAQPNACPRCGPHIRILDGEGRVATHDPVTLLKRGFILAVKGLGGFHLAADARNDSVVNQLRQRKQRDTKPLAVMARDLKVAHRYCLINPGEGAWLTSPQAPIVILRRNLEEPLPDQLIHPGLDTLGVLLPYTPLHYLLFDDEIELLIMTSANISDEPLITSNAEALDKLRKIADFFVVHGREIYNPCDDSVIRVTNENTPQLLRRARGFAPLGLKLPLTTIPVLALGGDMKNTFCVTRDDQAFLSQHWGDLNHYDNFHNYREGISRFTQMLSIQPRVWAYDLHSGYQSTRWALEQQNQPKIGVQHHHAHLASAMADNGLTGEVLGLICDGTGWGTDGAIWGCEVLKGGYHGFERLAHLQYVPMPGGDYTVKRPYRMALVYLYETLGEKGLNAAGRLLPDLSEEEMVVLVRQLQNPDRNVLTSSCGRLFDAVSAVLGICAWNCHEGQAAAELEARALRGSQARVYGYRLEKERQVWMMKVQPLWQEMEEDLRRGIRGEDVALSFHETLIAMFTEVLRRLRDESRINRVVLSGGVFHNQILLSGLLRGLKSHGMEGYQHRQVPPGDGGISLGQALIASEVNG